MCVSMEVVLPNGDVINTLPVPKHAAGPDLNEIFIGSEGTLGVITKATFKLFEQPESRQAPRVPVPGYAFSGFAWRAATSCRR